MGFPHRISQFLCPVRDSILVEFRINQILPVPLGTAYDYYRNLLETRLSKKVRDLYVQARRIVKNTNQLSALKV